MIRIKVQVDLDATEKRIDEKLIALNQAVHDVGFMLVIAIKQDIASYPSVDKGFFLNSIKADISKDFETTVYTDVDYAGFLEHGTSPHFIKPVTKKALAWKGGGQWFFSKGHMVSGIKPRRHFERVSLQMKPQILEYIEAKVKAVG